MDHEYISPFIASVADTFTTMLAATVKSKEAVRETNGITLADVNAAIDLTGSVSGTIVVTLSDETAVKLVSRMLYMELSEVDNDVIDGVSELLNMMAGGAKANLPGGQENPIHLGIPHVFQDQTEFSSSIKEWMRVPFSSELGHLDLWVALKADEIDK